MKQGNKQTKTTLKEELNSALKTVQEARLRKAKADDEFDLASAEVAALAMQLSNMEIVDDAKDYTTTNSKQRTTGIQTLREQKEFKRLVDLQLETR